MVPLSGKYAALGNEIRRSVEMALFTINNPKIELLFLDTKAGEGAGNATMTGIKMASIFSLVPFSLMPLSRRVR